MIRRRRFKQSDRLEDHLAAEAIRLHEEANTMEPGAARDDVLRKARQAETGSHMSEWLRSAAFRRPSNRINPIRPVTWRSAWVVLPTQAILARASHAWIWPSRQK